MKPAPFSIRDRLKSFQYAWQGIVRFLRGDHNAWVHAVATVVVIILASVVPLTKTELLALVFAVGFVWVAEMFNTCIERTMDFISTEKRPEIGLIKDVAAGAVLVAAITAAIIGGIVFIPKLISA
ncbi:diacylglycerol kinase family protein [Paraflavitalea soli]|uniref:Diacylglycerol kinase family protein n=1 Tax=Paraflavitalea soli TaxID=2315862 RepID=A0A3B7MTD0_9BACT|nr:diacylglycerol kinase family protein [Paraflavitalea soli]AXY76226.1 diacylglycerol kinase family protein [Paraflavitalea soli]